MLNNSDKIQDLGDIVLMDNGCLDGLIGDYISGWLTRADSEPCFFELYVNNCLVHEGFADHYREDLKHLSRSGHVGFSVSINELLKNERIVFSEELKIMIRSDHKRIANNRITIDNNLCEYFTNLKLGGIYIYEIESKIRISGLWDEDFYISRYLDSKFSGDPLYHYILFGWKKGFKPCESFSQSYYNVKNQDVATTGIIPLYHYIVNGEKEGRMPNEYFCPINYLEANPDLIELECSLLAHYIHHGIKESRPLKLNTFQEAEVKQNSLPHKSPYISSFELAKIVFNEKKLIKSSRKRDGKVIAYYLPQFHPFEQNDQWWGKSFTEWTNVTKAKPLLKNHEHPRLPTELGFYDLRLKDNIVAQVDMASSAGVDAFCLYYYWFNGTILMETPIETIYNNKDINIEYCICWANENWTRTWDGMDKEVLIEQTYSPEDDIEFISHVSKYFKDERYVKVDGKPLIVIYRPSIFPDMAATLKRWRNWAKENMHGELHITMVQFDDTDPNQYGFDAAVEFPPHKVASENVAQHMNFDQGFSGSVHDYSSMINNSLNKVDEGYSCYKAVTMAWDNTARRNDRASFFTNVSSGKLKRWLSGIEDLYKAKQVKECDNLVFVNAWNEWAEGTYLEPDNYHGFSYLNAVSDFTSDNCKPVKVALLAHIFYADLVEDIISYAKNIEYDFDILITCVSESYQKVSKRFNEAFPDSLVDIKVVPNRGRDIGPFLCNHVSTYQRYDYICKIHSKKSLHAGGIDNWRVFLYDRLLGSKEQVDTIVRNFKDNPTLGIQYPEYSDAIKPFISWGSNKAICQQFMDSLGLHCPDDLPDFPAGSMFWFRPKALNNLFMKSWDISDFPLENGQIDETVMHAVERCFLLLLGDYGYKQLTYLKE